MNDLYTRKAITSANAAIMTMLEPLITGETKQQKNKQWRECNWKIREILQTVAADSFVAGVETRQGVGDYAKEA